MRVNSFVQGHTGRTFTGVQEQFWPDAFPATTNDSYGYQQESEPRFAGYKWKSVNLTTEPLRNKKHIFDL